MRTITRTPAIAMLLSATMLAGCATNRTPQFSYDDSVPPLPTVQAAATDNTPRPLHVPPVWTVARGGTTASTPTARVENANAAARVEPRREGYHNAIQIYPWSEGALYQVYAAVGQITTIALEPGESLTGAGPIAAGDTARWIIGDTESGTGALRQVHILVKPTRPDLQTNLVINTNLRTYHLELRSTEKTYMASVSWQYPADQLIALRRQNARAAETQAVASGVDISKINFRYRIEGDSAPWRPLRAFDDGSKVYIEFPSGIGQGEMPPLFVIGGSGNSELVNYRARQNYYVVDRLFAAAELRLGDKDTQKRVRIVRTDGRTATAKRTALFSRENDR